MELRHLRHLEVLAEAGSFHRAARQLGLRQPALSLSIRTLEAEVGVPLVARTNSGSCLTQAGKAFLEETRHVFAALDTATLIAQGIASEGTGLLRLGIAAGAATGQMMRTLTEFVALQHRRVVVSDGATSRLLAMLQDGMLDICMLPVSADQDNPRFEPLWHEEVHLALSTAHPLAVKAAVDIDCLANELLVIGSDGDERGATASLLTACRNAGIKLRTSATLLQPEVRLALVAAGIGVAAQPASIQSFWAVASITSRPFIPSLSMSVAVACPDVGLKPIAREFIEIARLPERTAVADGLAPP